MSIVRWSAALLVTLAAAGVSQAQTLTLVWLGMNTLFGQENQTFETPVTVVAEPAPTSVTSRSATTAASSVLFGPGESVISYFAVDSCPCETKIQKKVAASCCCAETKASKGCCCAQVKGCDDCCKKTVSAAKGCTECCAAVAKAACKCGTACSAKDCCCAQAKGCGDCCKKTVSAAKACAECCADVAKTACKCDKQGSSKDCCCAKVCACSEAQKPKPTAKSACSCGKTCACCDCKPATRKTVTKTVLAPAPRIEWMGPLPTHHCPATVTALPHVRVLPAMPIQFGAPHVIGAAPFHGGMPMAIHPPMPLAGPTSPFQPASLPRWTAPKPMHEGHGTPGATGPGNVHLFLDGLEVHCHRLTCSGEHIVLEGDVRINYEIHGKQVRLHGQRVIMNPVNGSLQVEGGASVNPSSPPMPAAQPTCPPAATWSMPETTPAQPASYSPPAGRPHSAQPASTEAPVSRTAPCRVNGDCNGRTELPPKSADEDMFIFWLNLLR